MSVAYRRAWISTVESDGSLQTDTKEAAKVLASAGVVSRTASTDWQGINRALRRPVRDTCVLEEITELQRAGYLGRRQGNRFHQSRGWRLMLPDEPKDEMDFVYQRHPRIPERC